MHCGNCDKSNRLHKKPNSCRATQATVSMFSAKALITGDRDGSKANIFREKARPVVFEAKATK